MGSYKIYRAKLEALEAGLGKEAAFQSGATAIVPHLVSHGSGDK